MSVMKKCHHFFNGLSTLVQHIPKHNVRIIGGEKNPYIGKCENDKLFVQIIPNWNGEYLPEINISKY